ncbi:MAG: large subunit ribosomal protein L15 [Nitriliruptoraceae bacterium]|jgi:large subunit ribosomal protein L15
MKLHHLKPSPGSRKAKKRVARGDRGAGGKTAGRGTKGTGARGTVPAGFEGGQVPLQRRQPKLPGFKNNNKIYSTPINLNTLEKHFEAGDTVSRETLETRGLVRKHQPVKILGYGELTKSLTITSVGGISASAREKVVAAGGSVDL